MNIDKTKVLILSILLIALIGLTVNSISAANYYVNSGTSQNDIQSWIDSAKKGDNLVFTTSSYELKDTIKVTKPITIKSNVKTNINFKADKNMFNITTNDKVTFDGLRLNHDFRAKTVYYENYGDDAIAPYNIKAATLYSSKGFKIINLKNIDINVNGQYGYGIHFKEVYGNITNCNIEINPNFPTGYDVKGFLSDKWIGNIINTKISLFHLKDSSNIYSSNWKGNMINTEIIYNSKSSFMSPVSVGTWKGKLHNSSIYNNQNPISKDIYAVCFDAPYSKGIISNCTMISKSGSTLRVTDSVKISNCNLISKKGTPKAIILKIDLKIGKIKRVGRTYYMQILATGNEGQLFSIEPFYLGIKIGKNIKKVKIPYWNLGKSTVFKFNLPTKYTNKKYTKTLKIDYYNQIKETNEKNNIKKIKI